MKSKIFMQIYCLAAALLLSLSLSAEPVDHSTMHHEEHGEMQHDTHQPKQEQDNDASEHMQHDESDHHSGDGEHHGNVTEHHNHADMIIHEEAPHEAMQHTSGEHHAASSSMTMDPAVLTKLQTMPPSGKSREAGYDDRYVMESTSAEDSIATHCAQASRGLVMVDNATWVKCGGKPEGWSKGIGDMAATVSPMDHSQHMGH